MSSLADTLLEDFSSDEEDVDITDNKATGDASTNGNKSDDGDDGNDNTVDEEEQGETLIYLVAAKEAEKVGLYRKSQIFQTFLLEIKKKLEIDTVNITKTGGNMEDDPEYKLILTCNRIVLEIDDDISATHRYIVDIYSKKFPELDSLIPNKLDYTRTVKRIGNELDMTVIELGDILTGSAIMMVSVTGSTTSGSALNSTDLTNVLQACDEILTIEDDKAVILKYIESRMNYITPNICTLIGARLAAQVVGIAGGVVSLSRIPSCNVQVIGKEKYNLCGLSNISINKHAGLLQYADLVQSCPPFLRKRALKLVAAKVTLLARVDSYTNYTNGSEGIRMRCEVAQKIEKWQEPDKARTKRALPIPEEKKSKKRGGKKVRRMKERSGITELRHEQNKVRLSTTDGEYGDSAMGVTLGMVGLKDSGKLRSVQAKQVKGLLSKKQKKALSMSSSSNTSGLSSSVVFNSSQGLELVNPNAAAERVAEANKKWFSEKSGFLSSLPVKYT